MHEQSIICRQLFAGHVVGSRPMKRKEKNASNDNITYLSFELKIDPQFAWNILHITNFQFITYCTSKGASSFIIV